MIPLFPGVRPLERGPPLLLSLSGDFVPGVSDGVLHVLPCGLSAALEAIEVRSEIRLDIVEVSAAIAVRGLIAEYVARLVILERAIGRDIRSIPEILPPPLLVEIPVSRDSPGSGG